MSNLTKLDAAKLKELGVDFRVTKNELIDTIIEEQLENIEEEIHALDGERKKLSDEAFAHSNLLRVAKKVALPKHIKALLPKLVVPEWRQRHCGEFSYKTVSVYFTLKEDEKCNYKIDVTVQVPVEHFPQYKRVLEIDNELLTLSEQRRQLKKGTQKLRRMFLRQILASSDSGKELVAILDSYKAPRKPKALKA